MKNAVAMAECSLAFNAFSDAGVVNGVIYKYV
jgi:hypothetical protein